MAKQSNYSESLPSWAVAFRTWGAPSDVAARLDVPQALVVKAYHGDVESYRVLRNGTASASGRKLNLLAVAFRTIESPKRRPRDISKRMAARILQAVFPEAVASA